MAKKKRIGIIGQSGEISRVLAEQAYEVGRLLAAADALVFCGGRDGVMAAISQGVHEHGGLTVGILPWDDLEQANDFISIPITTGLSMETRSIVLIHSCDCFIMISGGNGTLGELSGAYLNRRPVVILSNTGGWSDRIKSVLVEGKYLDERKQSPIYFAETPQSAVQQALDLCELPLRQADPKVG